MRKKNQKKKSREIKKGNNKNGKSGVQWSDRGKERKKRVD